MVGEDQMNAWTMDPGLILGLKETVPWGGEESLEGGGEDGEDEDSTCYQPSPLSTWSMRTQFCQEVLSKTYYMWCCVEAFGGLHYNPKARLPAAARDRSPRSSPGKNKKDRTRESGGNRVYIIPSTVYLYSEYHGGKPTDKKLILQLFDSVMRQTKILRCSPHERVQ